MSAKLTSEAFAQKLHDAGLIPDLTDVQRIEITAETGRPLQMVVTILGTDSLADVVVRHLEVRDEPAT